MTEEDQIAAFIRENGVTRCPTAYAGETLQGAINPAAPLGPPKKARGRKLRALRKGWARDGKWAEKA